VTQVGCIPDLTWLTRPKSEATMMGAKHDTEWRRVCARRGVVLTIILTGRGAKCPVSGILVNTAIKLATSSATGNAVHGPGKQTCLHL
jgi:hypothetical protein